MALAECGYERARSWPVVAGTASYIPGEGMYNRPLDPRVNEKWHDEPDGRLEDTSPRTAHTERAVPGCEIGHAPLDDRVECRPCHSPQHCTCTPFSSMALHGLSSGNESPPFPPPPPGCDQVPFDVDPGEDQGA